MRPGRISFKNLRRVVVRDVLADERVHVVLASWHRCWVKKPRRKESVGTPHAQLHSWLHNMVAAIDMGFARAALGRMPEWLFLTIVWWKDEHS